MAVCAEWRSRVLAVDQLMDHNLAISDHQPAHCTLCSSTVHPTCKKQTRIAHHCKGYTATCTLFSSLRHSPQFMGTFHSFSLKCFIYPVNICTAASVQLLTIVGSCCHAAALALVLNCSSPLSHWPGNTPTYQKCFVTRPAGASLLRLNHWSGLQPVGHTFNHLSCCSLFKPVNNIECKNAIHRKTIIGGTLKFHKISWQVLLNA